MAGLALGAQPARAHDFWIVPSSFRARPGQMLAAHLRVGQELVGDVVRRNDPYIERFELVAPDGAARPLFAPPAAEPAGRARADEAGLFWMVYQSRPSVVDLEPDRVALYARQEGLDAFLGLEPGTEPPAIRDHFARCAKALVSVGDAPAVGWDRALGLHLELVLEADPLALEDGETLPVRLLLEGKPLADALVGALSSVQPGRPEGVRTDSEGRAALHVDGPGIWLLKAVYIEPRADAPGEWDSYWASVIFERAAAPPASH